MENIATVTQQDNTLHFYSAIQHGSKMKFLLRLLLILVIALYITMAWATINEATVTEEGMSKGVFFSVFLLAPLGMGYFFIRPILWNLFGEEELLLTPTHVQHKKGFGIYKGKWKIRDYQARSYEILDREIDRNLCVFRIGSFTQMDVPVVIYTTSILVNKDQVQQLLKQYERMTDIQLQDIPPGTHIT